MTQESLQFDTTHGTGCVRTPVQRDGANCAAPAPVPASGRVTALASCPSSHAASGAAPGYSRGFSPRHPRPRAFTLLELLVVIAVIALVAGIVMPGLMTLFSAGADASACNILTAQLIAARALALKTGHYSCVHIQCAVPFGGGPSDPNLGYYACVLSSDRNGVFSLDTVYDSGTSTDSGLPTITDTTKNWINNQWVGYSVRYVDPLTNLPQIFQVRNTAGLLGNGPNNIFPSRSPIAMFNANTAYQIIQPTGFKPIHLPVSIATAAVNSTTVTTASPASFLPGATINELNLSSTTIVFSPTGQVVPYVFGNKPTFYAKDAIFISGQGQQTQIWDVNVATSPTQGSSTIAVFDAGQYRRAKASDATGVAAADYLTHNSQYLSMNCYTGLLLQRK